MDCSAGYVIDTIYGRCSSLQAYAGKTILVSYQYIVFICAAVSYFLLMRI